VRTANSPQIASPERRAALRDLMTSYEVAYPQTIAGLAILPSRLWEAMKKGVR
jgi:hypothetical protein